MSGFILPWMIYNIVWQQNAQYWPDPKSSDIVFFSADLWGLHEGIQGGVEVSTLSSFNYLRWPPWTRKSSENASVMMDSTLERANPRLICLVTNYVCHILFT